MPNILSIDVGGSHVKVLLSGQTEKRAFTSGRSLTPQQMVQGVKKVLAGSTYDVVSIGYPGPVVHGRIAAEPRNLGKGWIGFDFQRAFDAPVQLMNDAAMQALGSYAGGRMLFLGLGTGLGSAMVSHGEVVPMELGHLPYRKHKTFEDYLGKDGLKRLGKKKWRRHVARVLAALKAALEPDYVVIGGGNADKLHVWNLDLREGDNSNAFVGGFRLWEDRGRRAT